MATGIGIKCIVKWHCFTIWLEICFRLQFSCWE